MELTEPTPTHSADSLLRRWLLANAAFSGLSGVALVAFGRAAIAPVTGIPWPILLGVGVGLLLFAAGIVYNANRPAIHLGEARLTIASDLAWVGGSVVVLALRPGALTEVGMWLIADVALIVAGFAFVQWLGVRRLASRTVVIPRSC